jgi:hypothetical protein
MEQTEKILHQTKAELLKESAAIEERIAEETSTEGDKNRLVEIKEELIKLNTQLATPKPKRSMFGKREHKPSGFVHTVKVLAVSVVVIVAMVVAAGTYMIHETGPEAIKKAVNYWSEQQVATQQLANALTERFKEVKNPSMEGMVVITEKDSNFITIFPESIVENPVHYKAVAAMVNKVRSWGYDSILIGNAYTSMSGRVFWTDFEGKNETDMEIIINKMREIGIKNCFAFVSNPDGRTWPDPIKNWAHGELKIQQVEVRRAAILWKTGESKIVFHADNITGQVRGKNVKIKVDNIPIEQIQQYHLEQEKIQKEKKEENIGYFSKAYNWTKGKIKFGTDWVLEKVE